MMRRLFFVLALALGFSQGAEAGRTAISNGGAAYAFTCTNGSFPSAIFTNNNGNTGEIVCENSGTAFREGYGAHSHGTVTTGTFAAAAQYCKITIVDTGTTGSDTDYVGCVVHSSGGNQTQVDSYAIRWGPSIGLEIVEYANGDNGTVLFDCTATITNGDTIALGIVGTTLTGYENDTAVPSCTATDGTLTTGKPGIVGHNNANALFGDDFESGDCTGGNCDVGGAASGLLLRRRRN